MTTERYYKNKHIATEGGMLVFLRLKMIFMISKIHVSYVLTHECFICYICFQLNYRGYKKLKHTYGILKLYGESLGIV